MYANKLLIVNRLFVFDRNTWNPLCAKWTHTCLKMFSTKCLQIIYIYIYRILSPVKPELGVIPSGQEIIHEWIFKSSW